MSIPMPTTNGQRVKLAIMQDVKELNEKHIARDEPTRISIISAVLGLSHKTTRLYLRDIDVAEMAEE